MEKTKAQATKFDDFLRLIENRFPLSEKQLLIKVQSQASYDDATMGKIPGLQFTSVSGELQSIKGELTGFIKIDPNMFMLTSPKATPEENQKLEQQIRDNVLESRMYPEIKLEISGISTSFGPTVALVKGTLSFHGHKKRLAFPLKVEGPHRLSGSIHLFQSDFGMLPSVVPVGVPSTRDEVIVSFEISVPNT